MNKTLSVLYVEDEMDIREVTEFALEDEGFDLMSCASGYEALAKAGDLTPDLILVDMMMPGMDGLATVENLRELTHLASTPVIFMTAKVQSAEKENYLAMGAVGVISKPFDAMALAGNIRKILAQAD